ncbi:hypothetical protein DFH09DRAFT_1273366, partial [Mycena vulgaris]
MAAVESIINDYIRREPRNMQDYNIYRNYAVSDKCLDKCASSAARLSSMNWITFAVGNSSTSCPAILTYPRASSARRSYMAAFCRAYTACLVCESLPIFPNCHSQPHEAARGGGPLMTAPGPTIQECQVGDDATLHVPPTGTLVPATREECLNQPNVPDSDRRDYSRRSRISKRMPGIARSEVQSAR